MHRRDFLQSSAGFLGLAWSNLTADDDSRGQVMTVGGPITPDKPGITPTGMVGLAQGCDDIGKKGYNIHTGHGRVNFGHVGRRGLSNLHCLRS